MRWCYSFSQCPYCWLFSALAFVVAVARVFCLLAAVHVVGASTRERSSLLPCALPADVRFVGLSTLGRSSPLPCARVLSSTDVRIVGCSRRGCSSSLPVRDEPGDAAYLGPIDACVFGGIDASATTVRQLRNRAHIDRRTQRRRCARARRSRCGQRRRCSESTVRLTVCLPASPPASTMSATRVSEAPQARARQRPLALDKIVAKIAKNFRGKHFWLKTPGHL